MVICQVGWLGEGLGIGDDRSRVSARHRARQHASCAETQGIPVVWTRGLIGSGLAWSRLRMGEREEGRIRGRAVLVSVLLASDRVARQLGTMLGDASWAMASLGDGGATSLTQAVGRDGCRWDL